MGTPYREWLDEQVGRKCVENLKKHGFDAHFAEDGETARDMVLEWADRYETFGFGGSDTTRSLGLHTDLAARGKTVLDHLSSGFKLEESLACRKAQAGCDCFLCSANAVSVTGEIVNVDGVGNRTNAMSFGPQKVVIVAGVNKIAHSLEAALKRVREIAAPMRAKSLGLKTPCAETGFCVDCNTPQRICNITTILHRKPMLTDISVVIVNERMGY